MSVILIRQTALHVKETQMRRHDEWRPGPGSQPDILNLSLCEYSPEERENLGSLLKTREDWQAAPMPVEYLIEIVDAPKGTPCRDHYGYVARIQMTIKDEYLDNKDFGYAGSSWEGLHSGWIAWALTWRAIDEALEIATSDEGIDWEWFDREMMGTLNKYIADLEALPDHDGECYEDRGEY